MASTADKLPGGRHGLFIPFSRRAPQFAWCDWDLRDYHDHGGPIKPVRYHTPPQDRTTLDLQAMYDAAIALKYAAYNRRCATWSFVLVLMYR